MCRVGVKLQAVGAVGGEGGGGVNGLVGGVGDEVDVGVGEFSADEADCASGGGVRAGELEVRGGEVWEGFGELGFVGNYRDCFGEFGQFGGGLAFGI